MQTGLAPLLVPGWQRFSWLWHAFSTRVGGVSRVYLPDAGQDDANNRGDLNLGFTGADRPESVLENRRRFVAALTGSPKTPLQLVRQVHSNRTGELTDACQAQPGTTEADGLMTAQPEMMLGVLTADCIPVLVVDPEHRAVAAFHAGWRGTVGQIVEIGFARMRQLYGTDPARAFAAIGPGIGACCYNVGEELRQPFDERFHYAAQLFSQPSGSTGLHLDLTEANRRQLLASGFAPESIAIVGGCTSCHPDLFFSHRASGGHTGRMMAVIGVKG